MILPTNYDHYANFATAHAHHHDACCALEHCQYCRLSEEHNAYRSQPWAVVGECKSRFGHAPYGMPLDLRIAWSIEPEKDPNPL